MVRDGDAVTCQVERPESLPNLSRVEPVPSAASGWLRWPNAGQVGYVSPAANLPGRSPPKVQDRDSTAQLSPQPQGALLDVAAQHPLGIHQPNQCRITVYIWKSMAAAVDLPTRPT
ncbi:hypothetical protein CCHR01_16049 [Colletotrichum chrysophilum]|uniref:Uncharacterized protein n=1 Tax=Colletotrichum chrysophilum TaxID=1836956 RepID=A0AAD9A4K9_9PEZI|nr:hypothetical protein CCHR01_16049 [Colletotrichum chrysophilum]